MQNLPPPPPARRRCGNFELWSDPRFRGWVRKADDLQARGISQSGTTITREDSTVTVSGGKHGGCTVQYTFLAASTENVLARNCRDVPWLRAHESRVVEASCCPARIGTPGALGTVIVRSGSCLER